MDGSLLAKNAEIVMGQSPPGETCNAAGIGLPLLNGPTDYGPHHPSPVQFTTDARRTAQPGDLLFCVRGSTTGRMNWADREYAIGRGVAAIRHHQEPELQPFVRAVVEYGLPGLLAQATGSTFPNVSAAQLASLWWPPIRKAEQRAIARILGALDDRIELYRQSSEALETMARVFFRSWFVDFDPVRAIGRPPNPGVPEPVGDRFPDGFGESELGKIPIGWQVTTLGDVLTELETGRRPVGGISGYAEGVPSIGAESITGLGVFDFSKTRYVPHEFFRRLTKGRVRSRDVLLYKDGGRPGEFEPHVSMFGDGFPFDPCAINEHVYRMRAKSELGQNYLFFWLSSDVLMEEMRNRGTGVAIPGLNSTQVRSLPVLVPTMEVCRAFDALVEPWIARVLVNSKDSRTLAVLRDTLLPALISGELRIGRADRVVEALPA